MKIKCLAIDDKAYLLKIIEGFIKKTPFLEVVELCTNPLDALDIVAEQKIDLIFLDISMPEMTGLEFVQALPKPVPIVFTTSHTEFAVDSYRLDAVDYLVKPFPYEFFLRAANKAKSLIESQNKEPQVTEVAPDFFYLKSEGKLVKVKHADIDFIESDSEYIKVHRSGQPMVMSLMSLKKIEESLPNQQFMRVHRSFIINLHKIEMVERARVLINSKYISVSEQYRKALKEVIDRFSV